MVPIYSQYIRSDLSLDISRGGYLWGHAWSGMLRKKVPILGGCGFTITRMFKDKNKHNDKCTAGAHNPGPAWRSYLRFPTHVSLQSCGAAVRGRNYDLHLLHVPGSPCALQRGSRVQYQPPFLLCVLCSRNRWSVAAGVSYSFICSCACVGLLYRSSICACVTFILFVFREQKMVQQMQEIVAKYEDRLRKIQSVRDYRTDDV